MNITIDEIQKKELTALQNLVKMYCCEWAQYNLFDVDDNGVYPFEKYIPLDFGAPRRHPFFFRADGKLAGFALLDADFAVHKNYDYSMGEFFVMPKYRRCGLGRIAAVALFNRFPGKWEVGFHPKNVVSVKFWTRVIAEYTSGSFALDENCPGLSYHDGTLGSVLSFDNADYANIVSISSAASAI